MNQPKSLLAEEMSNVWIYSFNPKSGVRAHCQLPNAVLSGPALDLPNLVDNVSQVTHQFDQLDADSVDQDQLDTLMAAATMYAKTSRAWPMLSSHSTAPSVHLVVMDWATKTGTAMKLVAANGEHAQALQDKSVECLAREALESHLLNFPAHKPL